jgi:hypothetical protein
MEETKGEERANEASRVGRERYDTIRNETTIILQKSSCSVEDRMRVGHVHPITARNGLPS